MLTLMLVKRVNLTIGISDAVFYTFGSHLSETVEFVVVMFVTKVVTARISPPGIEAFLMALGTTITQLSLWTLRNLMGTLINVLFIHMTTSNLESLSTLLTIKAVGALIPLLYLRKLIPSNEEV